MSELLSNEYVLLTLTFLVYFVAKWLQGKLGWAVLNPILVSIVVLIAFLRSTNIEYEVYEKSGQRIDFWLKPAVVALAVPLYRQMGTIRRQILPILVSQFVGCVTGIVSVVLLARMLGASKGVILSLAPKSVTTPIAMEVTRTLGGMPSLTASIVVIVGILGSIIGFKVLQYSRIMAPDAQGLSMGTAAHAVGTAAAMQKGENYGAFASLGLIINGILTALFASSILSVMGILN